MTTFYAQPITSEPHTMTSNEAINTESAIATGRSLMHARRDLCELLTNAQLRVLECLLGGMSMPQIARLLSRSTHTVHDHTKAIYHRLAVKTRVQLVLLFTQPSST